MRNRCPFILNALALIIAFATSACVPQTVEPPVTFIFTPSPTSTNTPLMGETVTPVTLTVEASVQESTPTAVPTTPIPAATIPVDMTPPQAASGQIRTLDVITTTFTVDGAQGIQYSIAEPGRLIGMLPNGDMILLGENRSLLITDDNFVAQPLFENVRLPIHTSLKENRIIFPLISLTKQYSIWSAGVDDSDPTFLGTTMGYFPYFSVTDDGKVLLNENNHLVLKWIEGETVQSQPLNMLETQLGLDWSDYDYVQKGPDEIPPWIDFTISPDGQWIAVFDSEQVKLWLATLDGQQVRDVPLDPAILGWRGSGAGPYVRFSDWSPDSSQIAYREGVWTNNPGINYHQIKIVDTSGGQPIQITSPDTTVGGYLAWSSDGQYIAFSLATFKSIAERQEAVQMGLEPQRGSDIFVANPDGSEAQKISETHYPDGSSLFWHPNKHMLLYTCWNGDNFDICTFDLDQ